MTEKKTAEKKTTAKAQERLKRTLVRKAHIFNMYEDKIKLSDGRIVTYDYLEHKGAAAVVPVLPDGRILLVAQYRDALDRMTLEIPAGGRDNDEEPFSQAAARELEEETGYRAGRMIHLVDLRTAPAFSNEKISVYAATELVYLGQKLDPDEDIAVHPYSIEALNEMIRSGEIEDSKTVAAIMSYQVFLLLGSNGLQ